MKRATRAQMVDSIRFAVDELTKAQAQLKRVPLPLPNLPGRTLNEKTSHQLGQTEELATEARQWVDYAIKTLTELVTPEAPCRN